MCRVVKLCIAKNIVIFDSQCRKHINVSVGINKVITLKLYNVINNSTSIWMTYIDFPFLSLQWKQKIFNIIMHFRVTGIKDVS